MSFNIPRNVILPVDTVDVRLEPGPHPFETENSEAIRRNWLLEKAANPALFDGTVVLLSQLSYADGRLEGRCHAVRFATFLLWRRSENVPNAEHTYAHAVLVSRDNALIAIRMGKHTVNAGSIYFAAGSFEPGDFVDGVADVDFNMIREVGEETGLDLGGVRRGQRYYALSTPSGTTIFRRYFLDADADEIAAGIRDFVAGDPDPEIEGPVVIRSPGDLPEGLKGHMPPIIAWHFSGAE